MRKIVGPRSDQSGDGLPQKARSSRKKTAWSWAHWLALTVLVIYFADASLVTSSKTGTLRPARALTRERSL
jgi:hypothetical protein